MIEIFVLSIIQGITEFLPISSSSHLILVSKYLSFNNQNFSIDVSLHIGSFLAVIVFFKKDILNFLKNKKIFFKILLSSLPVMIVGYILIKFDLMEHIRNVKIIGWTTIIFGVLLFISDRSKKIKKISKNFDYKSAVFVGFFQILSLIPGVSRSGITITAARFLKFERVESAKISFLMSIPTLAAVSFYGVNNFIQNENSLLSLMNLLSIFLSFTFSLITIKYFLKYVKKFSLNIFIIYRIILGVAILFLAYL